GRNDFGVSPTLGRTGWAKNAFQGHSGFLLWLRYFVRGDRPNCVGVDLDIHNNDVATIRRISENAWVARGMTGTGGLIVVQNKVHVVERQLMLFDMLRVRVVPDDLRPFHSCYSIIAFGGSTA